MSLSEEEKKAAEEAFERIQQGQAHKEEAEWHTGFQVTCYNEAFAWMSVAFRVELIRLCRNVLGNNIKDVEDTAQELAQQTLLIARENISGFRGDRGVRSLEPWLRKIAKNLCVKELARLKRQDRNYSLDRVPALYKRPIKKSQRTRWKAVWENISDDDLRHAIESLEDNIDRQIVRLWILRSMTIPEITEIMEMTESAVRKRMSRVSLLMVESLGIEL